MLLLTNFTIEADKRAIVASAATIKPYTHLPLLFSFYLV